MKKLSIIVPVYNVYPYLQNCLSSLQNQVYQNFEVILVDDGSTDGSGALCDAIAGNDTRIHVIHQENMGVSAARNAGLRGAEGDYIGFVDPDDWIEPEMYRDLIGLMEQDGTDAAFCGYWEEFEAPDPFTVAQIPKKTGIVTGTEAFYQCMLPIGRGYFTAVWNKCFRRGALMTEAGILAPFPLGHSIGEDELWLAQNYHRWHTVSLTSQPCYHWRQRAGSALRRVSIDSRWYQALNTKQEIFAYLPQDPDFLDMVKAKLYADMHHCIWDSHCVGTREDEQNFRQALLPYRAAFLKSGDHSRLKKAKYFILDGMCRLHLPKKWILLLGDTTRVKLQHKVKGGNSCCGRNR